MAATSAADGGRHAQDEERARVPTEGEPDGVRRLAHTADTGISVTALTFDLCLARAAAGMFAGFLRPTSEAARTVRTDVELEADSRTDCSCAGLKSCCIGAIPTGSPSWSSRCIRRVEIGCRPPAGRFHSTQLSSRSARWSRL